MTILGVIVKLQHGFIMFRSKMCQKLIRNRFHYLPVGKEIAKYLLVALYVKYFGLSRNRLQIIVSYTEAREVLVNLFHYS